MMGCMSEPTFGLMLLADLVGGPGERDWGLSIIEEQPPDGLVFRDHVGDVWEVTVRRQPRD